MRLSSALLGGPVHSERWKSRPFVAAALRVAILLVPAGISLGSVWVVSQLTPLPAGPVTGVLRLLGLLVLGVTSALVAERSARRLLPLTALLKMSMLFPDRAPSRLRAARRACSSTVGSALASGPEDDAQAVAERVVALLAALASHDRRTRGHAQRVHVLAELLAGELGLTRYERDKLRWAALMHDIGKLEVSPEVLNKPAKLDDDEWRMMRAHPEEGARLAGPLLAWLGPWGDGIAQHHERFDGNGYPRGLAGDEIGYAGRLVCLVDAFETMTAARPYKRAMATLAARTELVRSAGTQFDPLMVRAFLAIPLPKLLWAGGPMAFLVQLPFIPVIQAGGRTAAAGLTAASTGLVAGGAVVIGGALALTPSAAAVPSAGPAPVVTTAIVDRAATSGMTATPQPGWTAPALTPTRTAMPGPSAPPSSEPTASASATPTPTPLASIVPTASIPAAPTSPLTSVTSSPGVTVDVPTLPPIEVTLLP